MEKIGNSPCASVRKSTRNPVSGKTWRPFVVHKQAEVGDEVEFSRKTDGASGSACRYKIRLIKKGMKKEEKEVMENEENEVINNEKKEVKLFGAIIPYPNNKSGQVFAFFINWKLLSLLSCFSS